MSDKAIEALGRFARVVSDAAGPNEALELLANALSEHVCPRGVAVYALEPSGAVRLASERGLGGEAPTEVDLDEMATLDERFHDARVEGLVYVSRPLVAGASLYGQVVMALEPERSSSDKLARAEALIDLAALALGTAAHIAQLERQSEELRAQQEMLARMEKLRALGQMAAGVSHDLKNILNPLSLHIQVASRAIDRSEIADAKESLAEMKQVVARGVETLERLRHFSRESRDAKRELVALDELAREAISIGKARSASLEGRLPKIREELGAPPRVMATGSEIVSALVNLIVNALDAMVDKGTTLTLRSGADAEGSWIEVTDDGPGMPPAIAARIFEPFFTTKGREGTGLGLAMVYDTMQRLGGSAKVTTSPGEGTTIRLSFPCAPT